MAQKKRTKTDIMVSELEAKARQKVYRIKKKGAVNANELRPHVADKSKLTGSQKLAYARKLKEFVSRDNKVVVQQNNVAVPASDLETFNRYLNARNRKAAKAQKAIRDKSIKAGVSVAKQKTDEFSQVKRTQPFSSAAELKGEIASLKKTARSSFGKEFTAFKAGAIRDLRELGDMSSDAIADELESLSGEAFMWLYTYTDFKDALGDYLYDSALERRGLYNRVRRGASSGKEKILDAIYEAQERFGI